MTNMLTTYRYDVKWLKWFLVTAKWLIGIIVKLS